jgi:predicted enzyme related to lactoylglutathione lyase
MSNPVVHFEIGCRDKAATEQFYAKLFDWKMSEMGPATMIDTGGGGIAGHITALGHEPHHFTHFYVHGGRSAGCARQGAGIGRQDAGAAVEIPTGSFAWFADPEGNTVGIWKPK